MDFEDLGAKRLRKVRMADILAGKVLLEAIFRARFGGVGALVILPGKMWGKSGADSRAKSRANSRANSRAKCRAIPRLISEAKSRKSVKIVENDENLKSVL